MSMSMAACPNCGYDRDNRFCPQCGQNDRNYIRSLWRLIADLIKETFEVDGRLPRTLRPMFLRPGELAAEFSRNRRASYISPIRSYLFASILFFFSLAVIAGPGSRAEAPPDGVVQQKDEAWAEKPAKVREKTQDACAEADFTWFRRALAPHQRPMMDEILSREQHRRGWKTALCFVMWIWDWGTPPDPKDSATRQAGGVADGEEMGRGGVATPPEQQPATAAEETTASNDADLVAAEPPAAAQGVRKTNDERDFGVVGAFLAGKAVEVLYDHRAAASQLLDNLPLAMIVTLPAYALLLKLFFFSTHRYYTEHLVFAMHLHTFSFLVYTVLLLLPEYENLPGGHEGVLGQTVDWTGWALLAWVAAYYYFAFRRYYRNGRVVTACKWFVLGGCYVVLLIPGLMLSVATTLVFL